LLGEEATGTFELIAVVGIEGDSVKIANGGFYFYFLFSLYFILILILILFFLFLEQLRLGFVSHTVTSVTS